MYFQAPNGMNTGDLQATITAQLGQGGVAGQWKVGVYNRVTDQFDPMGADNTLAGGKLSSLISYRRYIFVYNYHTHGTF